MFGRKTIKQSLASLNAALTVADDATATANKALQLVERLHAENESLRRTNVEFNLTFDEMVKDNEGLKLQLIDMDERFLRTCGIVVEDATR